MSSNGIQGDEGSFVVPIQFSINEIPNKNEENLTSLYNNTVMVIIPVKAKSTVDVQMYATN